MGAPDYQPYLAGAFRWRLGLRPLDLSDWIEVAPDHAEAMSRKRRILADHHGTTFAMLDGIEAESIEVLDALVENLREFHPALLDDSGMDGSGADGDRHPLDRAGHLVHEDLLLLVERDGRLVFGGGSLASPNRWDLRSKLGRSMADVHGPVPQLNEQLGDPIDRFLDRLEPERSFWRLGWGVIDSPELYQPLDGSADPRPAQPSVADLHLRVERETLRRFPVHHSVLFTIRTYITPLGELADRVDDAERLAAAIDALPPDVATYKQLDRLATFARSVLSA